MGTEGGLDALGNPLIDLPMDQGDGPFATATPPRDATRPALANASDRFRRSEPFEDNFLTRTSNKIAAGICYVGDTIPPNSFRRVHQHFSLRTMASLQGQPVIRFWGDPWAIIEEGTNMLAPGPQGNLAIQRAMDTLDGVQELTRPTLSLQTSFYQIRFRMPGYETVGPNGFNRIVGEADLGCLPGVGNGLPMPGVSPVPSNEIVEFPFSNSGSSLREFEVNYSVGDSIPIIFDIVNHNPTHAIQVAFSVWVLIRRE